MLLEALAPLAANRLVRQEETAAGKMQYELAYDFAVCAVLKAWRDLDRRRIGQAAVLPRAGEDQESPDRIGEAAHIRADGWASCTTRGISGCNCFTAASGIGARSRILLTRIRVRTFILGLMARDRYNEFLGFIVSWLDQPTNSEFTGGALQRGPTVWFANEIYPRKEIGYIHNWDLAHTFAFPSVVVLFGFLLLAYPKVIFGI
jgi:hypothetical protein